MFLRPGTSLSALMWLAFPLQAGVVFEIEVKDNDTTPPSSEITLVKAEGRMINMEMLGRNGQPAQEMVFRGDRREMIAIDHASQSYFIMDEQMMKALANQLQQARSQMDAVMRDMPADQRALMEKTVGDRLSGLRGKRPRSKPVVQRTNQSSKVYGYPCTLYQISRDRRKESDVWVTNWNNIQGSKNLIGAFLEFGDFMGQLQNAMPKGGGGADDFDSAFATMKQLQGFPVASREYRADGSVESESALRSAKVLRINPVEFEPPVNYQLQQMPGQGGQIPAGNGQNYRGFPGQ